MIQIIIIPNFNRLFFIVKCFYFPIKKRSPRFIDLNFNVIDSDLSSEENKRELSKFNVEFDSIVAVVSAPFSFLTPLQVTSKNLSSRIFLFYYHTSSSAILSHNTATYSNYGQVSNACFSRYFFLFSLSFIRRFFFLLFLSPPIDTDQHSIDYSGSIALSSLTVLS